MSSLEIESESSSGSDLDTPKEHDYVGAVPVFASHMSPDSRTPRDMMHDFMSFNLVSLSTKDLQRILQSFEGVHGLSTDMRASEWYSPLHTLIARSVRPTQDNDFSVLFKAFTDDSLTLDLLPVMLWAFQYSKPHNYVEPLLVEIYMRLLPALRESLASLPFGSKG
jgi:hypothetical protein